MKKRSDKFDPKKLAEYIWEVREHDGPLSDKIERLVQAEYEDRQLQEIDAHLAEMYRHWCVKLETTLRQNQTEWIRKEIELLLRWYASPASTRYRTPSIALDPEGKGKCAICGETTLGLMWHEYHDVSAVLAGKKPAAIVSKTVSDQPIPQITLLREEAERRGLCVLDGEGDSLIIGKHPYARRALAARSGGKTNHALMGVALGYPKHEIREFMRPFLRRV
jgi:hypothetical protein